MTGTHGTNASGDEQSNQTPQTRAVAVAEWVDARDSPSATVKHEDRVGGDTDGLAGLTRGVEQ